MQLVWPAQEYLADYVRALERGWSADNVRGVAAALDELAAIERDAAGFVASLVDPEGRGAPIVLPDGSSTRRLPGYRRWMWDGEFCGSINLRWQPGTSALPPTCLGHIGYAVVPWKQRQGHATQALRLLLPEARERGLDYVEISTDADNLASQKVIEANGGMLIERFAKPAQYGVGMSLRYRIPLR